MKSSEVKSILILPFNVLITIPFLITLFSKNDYPIFVESYSLISVLVGVLMGIIGLILVGWTISDFSKLGKGSLAPWNPHKKSCCNMNLSTCSKSYDNRGYHNSFI